MLEDDNNSLEGKVALVTGAAQRIGAATVRMLHRQGMNILLHYNNSSGPAEALCTALEQRRSDSVALLQGDLQQNHTLHRLIDRGVERWGRLDLLVNNASTFYPTPIGSITDEDWEKLIGTNLKAPLFLSQAAAPHLRQHRGTIINLIDIHGERPLKSHTTYIISKAGMAMLTRSLARELGPEIRVNGVSPGAILWPQSGLAEETRAEIIDRTALKRSGEPDDIARTILFLLRDAHYITGQIIAVDGGRTLSN